MKQSIPILPNIFNSITLSMCMSYMLIGMSYTVENMMNKVK
jgi:hypothetical protein